MNTDARHQCNSARLLLVVDQPVLTKHIKKALADGLDATGVAPTTERALMLLRESRPHLVIIDLDLANEAFLDYLSTQGSGPAPIPVIALTRRGDLQTKLAAFERGVDDIITIPFSPQELGARIIAVMRRTYRAAPPFAPVLRLHDLEIDMLNRSVRVENHALHLTALDQSLLYLLAVNAGQIVTRDEILNRLWGIDFEAESNVVDRHIRNLRVKLQDDWQCPRYIVTVPGLGYLFMAPATSAPPAFSPEPSLVTQGSSPSH